MRSVVWSVRALDDLKAALDYIADESSYAAEAVADRIGQAAAQLGSIPTGRPGRVHGMYEKSVARTAYIIAYAVSEAEITILRVVHTRRDWPEGEWPAQ